MIKISESVSYTGVLNPNLRVFDVIMKTDYGTSYNSYVVKGSEKTALVETAHLTFFNNYLRNINEVVDIHKVDYLIMNHNEPDHSGAIARLLELNPSIKIITSPAGSIYLKNIVNRTDMQVEVVKDGDTLSLGDKTLRFINAPFLHWPDSMFTWLEEDRILFSCDFLGTHYCEPQIMDTEIVYRKKYEEAFLGYYEAIFSPFKPYVLKGLEKIKDLDIEFVCNSHGPILTKDGLLEQAKEKYRKWSTPMVKAKKNIPIFFCSAYGNTEILAKSIGEGILMEIPNAEVGLYDIIEHDMSELARKMNESDAFLIGSPTINRDAVPPVWMLLSNMEAVNIAKRPVAVFGSFGWSGEAFSNITQRLQSVKANVYKDPLKVTFVPTKEDCKRAVEFGQAFAKNV